ncbi:MAG: hypothetical protein AAFY71_26590, partial [Bacteroidota bacterium]
MRNYNWIYALLFWAFGAIQLVSGQEYRISNSIPVNDINGIQLEYPWIGGLNNPHPSNIDLNGDGTLDVVI